MKVAGSNLCRIFHATPRCLLVHYSVGPQIKYNGQWLSGLSCLFLHQNYWPCYTVGRRFESPQLVLFLNSTFILSTQIINSPTSHSFHMSAQLPHYQIRLVFVALYSYYSMIMIPTQGEAVRNALSDVVVICGPSSQAPQTEHLKNRPVTIHSSNV